MKSLLLTIAVSVVSWLPSAVMGASATDIYEIESISRLDSVVDAMTWVVFDIDNTLIAPKNNVGSDAWFHEVWSFLQRDPDEAAGWR